MNSRYERAQQSRQQEFLKRVQIDEQAREEEKQRQASTMAETWRRAPTMAKWLRVMFWLTILSAVFNGISELSSLSAASSVIVALCGLYFSWALLQLQNEDRRYQTAAICTAISAVLTIVLAHFNRDHIVLSFWTLFLPLLVLITSLVSEYNKCAAHSHTVGLADKTLGKTWKLLWRWQIFLSILSAVNIGLLLSLPMISGLLSATTLVATLIVDIVEIAVLYRSAEVFKMKMKK